MTERKPDYWWGDPCDAEFTKAMAHVREVLGLPCTGHIVDDVDKHIAAKVEEARSELPPGYERTEMWASPDKFGYVEAGDLHNSKADAEEDASRDLDCSNGTVRQVILGPVEEMEPEDDALTKEARAWLEGGWRPSERHTAYVRRPHPVGRNHAIAWPGGTVADAMRKLLDEGWKP